MKRKIFAIGVIGLLIMMQQTPVLAAAKTFFIKGSNIKSLGTAITVGNANIIFSKTLYLPATTTPITDFAINSGVVYDAGSPAGRNVQVDIAVNQAIDVTVWKPSVGANNYYGKKTLTMSQANFDDSSLTWNWDNFAIDYKAAAPYKPKITAFAEATTSYTDGTAASSTLTISSASGSGSDGLREVTYHAWKMWVSTAAEPTAAISGATGASLSLSADEVSAGTTYSFRVADGNTWDGGSPTWSDVYSYTVAGGGAGTGHDSTAVALTKQASGFGVNSFGIPYETCYSGSGATVSTIKDLITTLNATGDGYVATVGYWEGQKEIGFTLDASGNVKEKINTTANPEEVALVKGMGYQVSVTGNKTLVLRNYP